MKAVVFFNKLRAISKLSGQPHAITTFPSGQLSLLFSKQSVLCNTAEHSVRIAVAQNFGSEPRTTKFDIQVTVHHDQFL
jgi:hypothetical protein